MSLQKTCDLHNGYIQPREIKHLPVRIVDGASQVMATRWINNCIHQYHFYWFYANTLKYIDVDFKKE